MAPFLMIATASLYDSPALGVRRERSRPKAVVKGVIGSSQALFRRMMCPACLER